MTDAIDMKVENSVYVGTKGVLAGTIRILNQWRIILSSKRME